MEEGVSLYGPIMIVGSIVTLIITGVTLFQWQTIKTIAGYSHYIHLILIGMLLMTVLSFVLHLLEDKLQESFLDRGIYNKEGKKLQKEIEAIVPQYSAKSIVESYEIDFESTDYYSPAQIELLEQTLAYGLSLRYNMYKYLTKVYIDTQSVIELIASEGVTELHYEGYKKGYQRLGELKEILTNKELKHTLRVTQYYVPRDIISYDIQVQATALGMDFSGGMVNSNPEFTGMLKPYLTLADDFKKVYRHKKGNVQNTQR